MSLRSNTATPSTTPDLIDQAIASAIPVKPVVLLRLFYLFAADNRCRETLDAADGSFCRFKDRHQYLGLEDHRMRRDHSGTLGSIESKLHAEIGRYHCAFRNLRCGIELQMDSGSRKLWMRGSDQYSSFRLSRFELADLDGILLLDFPSGTIPVR